MKCATGIQPSPHNSPIYDWAKLLSMRRIKSRARVQEKSAGRRDGRPRHRSPRSASRFPDVEHVGETRTDRHAWSRARAHVSPCGASRFSFDFSSRLPRTADKFAEKLNAVRRGRAHSRRCNGRPARPIAFRCARRFWEAPRCITARPYGWRNVV